MTRTGMVGGPTPTQQRRRGLGTESWAAGVAAVRPGVGGRDVDAACREVIESAGWGDAFVHGTGHGVGLEIHEAPRVARTASGTLAPGYVVTVAAGVYLPWVGGARV